MYHHPLAPLASFRSHLLLDESTLTPMRVKAQLFVKRARARARFDFN